MGYSNQFFQALGLSGPTAKQVQITSQKTGIPASRLKYYNDHNTLPSGYDLQKIIEVFGVSEIELQLKTGRLERATIDLIQAKADLVLQALSPDTQNLASEEHTLKPVFETRSGKLYQTDCLNLFRTINNDTVDLIFADPPFNLDKLYPSKIDDNLKEEEYLRWTESWLKESIRALKHGGALCIWNLPKWNSNITSFLHGRLTFKHWIAVDIKYSLPIQGRLYPSHYSLLYYVKGEKPNKLQADRLPTPTCPSCFDNLKDYGGYKSKMNPLGISLTDIWTDIPPVRHAKYKKRVGANELPVKLLDRIIEMTTNEGDLIVDPFGGSGCTYAVSELKGRSWIGSEIGPCDDIIDRFSNINEDKEHLESIRSGLNHLYPPVVKKERDKRGLWTAESVKKIDAGDAKAIGLFE